MRFPAGKALGALMLIAAAGVAAVPAETSDTAALAPVPSPSAGGFAVALGGEVPAPLWKALVGSLGKAASPDAWLVQFVDCDSARCEDSLRALQKFVAEPLAGSPVFLVAVAVGDDAAKAKALAERADATFPVLPDADRTLFALVAEQGVPRTLVLDAKGTVRYRHGGFSAGREAEFRRVLEMVRDDERVPSWVEPAEAGGVSSDPDLMALDIRGKQAPEVPVAVWINPPPESTAGKYILYDFWATWCGPCVESLKEGERLHGQFEDRLVTLAISDESPAKVKAFVKKLGLKQPIGVDPQGRAAQALQIQSIPHGFLVDPSGRVIWQGHPGVLWAGEGRGLKALLKDAPAKATPAAEDETTTGTRKQPTRKRPTSHRNRTG